jgi:MATE family multidrug resistance protein
MRLLPSRDRRATIIALGLPIIGGMASQNLLNVVDTAMVGTLGDVALAATGIGGFANFMAVSFIMGLSAGVQAIAARRLGENRHDVLAVALNAGLVLAFVWAIPWTALFHGLAPQLFGFLVDDPAVAAQAVPYFQVRLLAALGVGINFAFRGYWNGINQPKLYMSTLIVSHAANLFLNWVLIYGNLGAPALGTLGAGMASAIATYVAVLTYIVLGLRMAIPHGFLRAWPSRADLTGLIKVAFPASVAQFFMATGYTALMWIVGQTGTAELAAANVLLTITLVAVLPGLAFGFVAASLVGQALGRGDVDDAEAWGWDVARTGVITLGLMGLPMLIVPELLLSFFLHSSDTVALAVPPLRLVGATIGVDAVGLVLLNALYGAGHSRPVMIVGTTTQWAMGLPLAYLFGPVLGMGLLWMWSAIMLYRAGQAAIYAWMWRRRSWAEIAL